LGRPGERLEICPRCALPSPGGAVCGRCLRHPPAFDRARAAFSYGFPLDALIQHFKYAGDLALADLFAELLAEKLKDQPRPDLLLAMPLHPRRLTERGYNQAAEIARRLAPRLDMSWRPDGLRRLRDTPPQAGLKLLARRRNLRGAFACDLDLGGLRVALLDDVMTSGSSLGELAKCVRRAGAVEVEAWVVARTL
jgi:ComF family protein